MRCAPILLVLLGACGAELPPPDAALSAEAQRAAFPRLLPLDPLLAEGARPPRAATAGAELRGRADRLTGTAIPAPDTGDLPSRGEALRARAEALRDADV